MKIRSLLLAIGSILLFCQAAPAPTPARSISRPASSVTPSRQENPHGDIKMSCTDCHSAKRWKPTKRILDFNHSKTGFPLAGSHASVSCTECHKDLKFQSVSSACADCHKDIHKGKFGNDCQACHTPKKWGSQFLTVEAQAHNQFPLVGFHAIDECVKCHKNQQPKNYANTPTNCNSCHMAEFDKTTAPNHKTSNFSTDCASCHATAILTGWNAGAGLGASGMSHPASLPLTGVHGKISCFACHRKDTFTGLNPQCASCHQKDYNATTQPNHRDLAFPTDCAVCHSNENWRATVIPSGTQFKHPDAFPLTGGHAKPKCADCPAHDYVGTKSDCAGCHDKDYQATTNPNHAQQKFSMDCKQCHTTGAWKGAMIPPGTNFQHPTTFPLQGGHAVAACADCHKNGTYTNTPTDCFACHKSNYDTTRSPSHTDLAFGTSCADCHNVTSWLGAVIPANHSFKHPATFPLDGGHSQVDCAKCHAQGYVNTPTLCDACHDKDYKATTNPKHVDLKFSTDCALCHIVNKDWKGVTIPAGANFQHPATFPLAGGHSAVDCAKCHAQGYSNTPTLCDACHDKDYKATTSPNHVDLKFSTDCAQCHIVNKDWKGAVIQSGSNFQHPATFPLSGGHAKAACAACHASGYTNTPVTCVACHQGNYDTTSTPKHVDMKFSTDCKQCHNTGDWKGAMVPPGTNFQHPTTFPLTGGHGVASCADCHKNGTYTNTPTDCFACHKPNYDTTHAPNHATLSFGTGCADCHNITSWLGAVIPANHPFKHPATFPLDGGHSAVDCAKCHASGYTNTPTLCDACHDKDYKATTDPSHVDLKFSTDCALCHTVNKDWSGATIPAGSSFQHPATFPLTGGHGKAACSACHATGYSNTPVECVACHKTNFDKTTNPSHSSLNFSTDCKQCHTVNVWTDATIPPGAAFQHPATFPLVAGHANVTCMACHATGYTNTPKDCNSCHNLDYAKATPNHTSLGLPTNCSLCHTTMAWTGATIPAGITINHPATFPLTTPHDKATCVQCHAAGYTTTPTDCYSCHKTDYVGVVSPNHVTSNFSTNCLSCHKPTTWAGATFDHSKYFPIASGRHSGFQCVDCHTVPGNDAAFECILCHTHSNKASMDSKHQGKSGYTFTSKGCYSCHPKGSAG